MLSSPSVELGHLGDSFKPDSTYRQNICSDIDGVENPKLTEVTDTSVCNSKAFR